MKNYLDPSLKINPPLLKVLFDKFLAISILALTLPVSLVIVMAIKLNGLLDQDDRGPIFYSEERVSQGKAFKLFKFRILKVKAIDEQIIKQKRMPKAVENQPGNLTRVGKVLKKTGLDEIPQFWNILKGDMSFVGPRPKPITEYEEEIGKGIYRRKVIRAGLSGPAQVMKGTNRTYEDELQADFDYIKKCQTLPSWKILLFDLSILWRTIKVLLKMTGE
jgi:lipopolysaccharide/colanic/teichoic acid biosynthesis glycosyltransferase